MTAKAKAEPVATAEKMPLWAKLIVAICLMGMLGIMAIVGCALYLMMPEKPAPGGTVVEATYRQQLDPILDGTAAQFYGGVFDAMAVDLSSDAPTATSWTDYQALSKRLGKAANNGEPISVNLVPVLTQVFAWTDGKRGGIEGEDQKKLAATFRSLGEAAKACE